MPPILCAGQSSSRKPRNFSWAIKGKLAGSARPENQDQLRWLRDIGIRAIACLNKEYPLEEKQIAGFGFEYCFIPVKDFSAPKLEDIIDFVSFVNDMARQHMPVLVCCGAGIGRTGTMLVAFLVSQCMSPEDALKQIQEKRGVGVESYSQRVAILEYARYIGKCEKQPI